MDWPYIDNLKRISSPGLLLDPGRVSSNIEKMTSIAGVNFPERLRPHLKTHKMGKVTQLQIDKGITQFKAATINEARMAAKENAKDVLLAYQPVGPNITKLGSLIDQYQNTSFAAVTDNIKAAQQLTAEIGNSSTPVRMFIDVNCGMNRTGISFTEPINTLRKWIEKEPGVEFSGLHVYDGHLHHPELETRKRKVMEIKNSIENYISVAAAPEIIVGGSPTFGLWAELTDWKLSPGTTTLWDAGYARSFPDLDFSIAACLLTRVISKPSKNLICVDLGHKSVAAENELQNRVFFPSLKESEIVGQSEEHLVIKTSDSKTLNTGDTLLGFPQHICPTVALHSLAHIINDNRATDETWKVNSRNRI